MCLLLRPGGEQVPCFIRAIKHEQPSRDRDVTLDGKSSRTKRALSSASGCCCFVTEHNVTVPADGFWLSGWVAVTLCGAFQLLLMLPPPVCGGAEGRRSAFSPVDSGISHLYLAELWWRSITLPRRKLCLSLRPRPFTMNEMKLWGMLPNLSSLNSGSSTSLRVKVFFRPLCVKK